MIRLLAVVGGSLLITVVLLSALQTVVLPTGGLTRITRFVFAATNRIFIRRRGFIERFGWSRLFAPVSLVMLPLAWASSVLVGFGFINWSLHAGSMNDSMAMSGSSLFTLGFIKPPNNGLIILSFLEALIGLGLVALLISFLPTLYSAFSEREQGVGLFRPVLGMPPVGTDMLRRMHAMGLLGPSPVWSSLAQWFSELQQSHTAFPVLSSFPPQVSTESWVVTAGAILDAGALALSSLDHSDVNANTSGPGAEFVMVVAHGLSAVTRVGSAAGLPGGPERAIVDVLFDPVDDVEIRVTRAEFDEAVAQLRTAGLPIREDLEEGWRVFRLVRGSYEDWILGLAGLTHAPTAPWTSDRPFAVGRPHFFSRRPLQVTMKPPDQS